MNTITYNNLSDNLKAFPVYFHAACDNYIQESVKRPAGSYDFHQILIVTDGNGILKYKGNSYVLKKGCAFFTAVGTPIEYINTDGLSTAFLTAKGNCIYDLIKCFSCDEFLFYESVNTETYISDIKKIINNYYNRKCEGLLSAMTYSFYINFFEQQNKEFTKLDEVVLYIEKNFIKKLTLTQLANIGCFSVSKLCHDFKNKFHHSVFQYIIDLRLTYARNLMLSNPKMLTKETAVSCGFEDISYFCRAYKKKFGESPAKTRENLLYMLNDAP